MPPVETTQPKTACSAFDRPGMYRGAILSTPLALGVAAYGLVYGVLARQTGLSLPEALSMSSIVFAGAAQFVVLDMWEHPLPVVTMVLTVGVVNMRHLLMGATLAPVYKNTPPLQVCVSMFFLIDETWALTVAETRRSQCSAGFLTGAGIMCWLGWTGATLAGYFVGSHIPRPEQFGLDFAFTAAFLALLIIMWRGKQDIPVWLVAMVAALAGFWLLPGKWYILAGGIAGGIAGVWNYKEPCPDRDSPRERPCP